MTARRTKFMKESGPYRVLSCADGSLRVTPEWPQDPPWSEDEGGGPGLFSRLQLAAEIEEFLNVGTRVEAKEKSRACGPALGNSPSIPSTKGKVMS